MGRREAAFWILVDRRSAEFGREIYVEDGEMCEVREILDGIPDETVLAVSVGELARIAEKMSADAEVDGAYDEHGIGHAWVVPGLSFDEARRAVWTPRRRS